MLILALAACVLPDTDTDVPATPPSTVADLWDADNDGATVTLDEVVVTSPRTADRTAFFVQDPGGGPRSGLAVLLRGSVPDLPPPVGTRISVTGGWHDGALGPTIDVDDTFDVTVLGDGEATPTPWGQDDLGYALVTAAGVEVTSMPDPLHQADTNAGFGIGGAFGVTPPGWQATGDLTGIVTADGRVSLRTSADWTGGLDGQPPLEVGLGDVRGLADGVPVHVVATQAAPWSPGDRWTVLQDATGDGVWVDAEGFGTGGTSAGDVVSLIGEVRSDGEGLRLRTWTPAEDVGDAPIADGGLADGAVTTVTTTVTGGPDEHGWWTTTDAFVLGDRFGASNLTGTLTVTGPVRVWPDGTVELDPVQ